MTALQHEIEDIQTLERKLERRNFIYSLLLHLSVFANCFIAFYINEGLARAAEVIAILSAFYFVIQLALKTALRELSRELIIKWLR